MISREMEKVESSKNAILESRKKRTWTWTNWKKIKQIEVIDNHQVCCLVSVLLIIDKLSELKDNGGGKVECFFGNVQPGGDDVEKPCVPLYLYNKVETLGNFTKCLNQELLWHKETLKLKSCETEKETEKRFAHHQGSSRTAKVRLEK